MRRVLIREWHILWCVELFTVLISFFLVFYLLYLPVFDE